MAAPHPANERAGCERYVDVVRVELGNEAIVTAWETG